MKANGYIIVLDSELGGFNSDINTSHTELNPKFKERRKGILTVSVDLSANK